RPPAQGAAVFFWIGPCWSSCSRSDLSHSPSNRSERSPVSQLLSRLFAVQRLLDRLDGDVRPPLDDLPAELDGLLFRHDADPVDGRLVRRDALLQSDILRIAGHQDGGESVIVVVADGIEYFSNVTLGC